MYKRTTQLYPSKDEEIKKLQEERKLLLTDYPFDQLSIQVNDVFLQWYMTIHRFCDGTSLLVISLNPFLRLARALYFFLLIAKCCYPPYPIIFVWILLSVHFEVKPHKLCDGYGILKPKVLHNDMDSPNRAGWLDLWSTIDERQ